MALDFTKNQTLVLDLFFRNPGRSFYTREMGRLLGKEPGVFQKDLDKLSKEAYLISERKANSRFFRLNIDHPLYEEIKSIFKKTLGAPAVLKGALEKVSGIDAAFIYGSVARGGEDSMSDIDLMVVGTPDEDALTVAVGKAQDRLDREVNYSIFSGADWQAGLKRREVFLEEIRDNEKIFIIGDQNELEKIGRQRRPARKTNQRKRG